MKPRALAGITPAVLLTAAAWSLVGWALVLIPIFVYVVR